MWLLGTIVGLVLLFSYRTSTMGATSTVAGDAQAGSTAGTGGAAGTAGGADPGTGTTPDAGTTPNAGGTTTAPAPASGTQTVKGSVANTRWGPVQVQVKISGGKITEVTTLQVPDGNGRDREINDYAVPILREEVLAEQSAQIDSVSGATVTSVGYKQSLQAALDSAHFNG
jgi:uncharacterized protein with FMN-binding domain